MLFRSKYLIYLLAYMFIVYTASTPNGKLPESWDFVLLTAVSLQPRTIPGPRGKTLNRYLSRRRPP